MKRMFVLGLALAGLMVGVGNCEAAAIKSGVGFDRLADAMVRLADTGNAEVKLARRGYRGGCNYGPRSHYYGSGYYGGGYGYHRGYHRQRSYYAPPAYGGYYGGHHRHHGGFGLYIGY